jgi:hypothetical protein
MTYSIVWPAQGDTFCVCVYIHTHTAYIFLGSMLAITPFRTLHVFYINMLTSSKISLIKYHAMKFGVVEV